MPSQPLLTSKSLLHAYYYQSCKSWDFMYKVIFSEFLGAVKNIHPFLLCVWSAKNKAKIQNCFLHREMDSQCWQDIILRSKNWFLDLDVQLSSAKKVRSLEFREFIRQKNGNWLHNASWNASFVVKLMFDDDTFLDMLHSWNISSDANFK